MNFFKNLKESVSNVFSLKNSNAYYKYKLLEKVRQINEHEADKHTFNRIFDDHRWCLEFVDREDNVLVINNQGELLKVLKGNQDELTTPESKELIKNQFYQYQLRLNDNVDEEFLKYINIDHYYVKSFLNLKHEQLVVIKSAEERKHEQEKAKIKEIIKEINDENS